MNWTTNPPTRPGKYKMKDAENEYVVYVEKTQGRLLFRKKGDTLFYTFNGTDGCQWAKCR